MTCHARGEFFCPKTYNIFSALGIVKYNPGKTNNKFVKSLFTNFYPDISHRQVQKESDVLLYAVLVTRYGPQSITLRNNNFTLFWENCRDSNACGYIKKRIFTTESIPLRYYYIISKIEIFFLCNDFLNLAILSSLKHWGSRWQNIGIFWKFWLWYSMKQRKNRTSFRKLEESSKWWWI